MENGPRMVVVGAQQGVGRTCRHHASSSGLALLTITPHQGPPSMERSLPESPQHST